MTLNSFDCGSVSAIETSCSVSSPSDFGGVETRSSSAGLSATLSGLQSNTSSAVSANSRSFSFPFRLSHVRLFDFGDRIRFGVGWLLSIINVKMIV